jgi:hypothetical protein
MSPVQQQPCQEAIPHGRAARRDTKAPARLAIVTTVLLGCVNLTPPWDQQAMPGAGGNAQDGPTGIVPTGAGGTDGEDATPTVDASAQGGSGGALDAPLDLPVPSSGGAPGLLDASTVDGDAGSFGETGSMAQVDSAEADASAPDAAVDVVIDLRRDGTTRDGFADQTAKGDSNADSVASDTSAAGAGGTTGTGGSAGTGGAGTGGATATGGSGAGTGGATATGGSGAGGTGGATATGGSGAGGTGGAAGAPSDGLVAYYACDQTAGPTLLDLSGNQRNAALVTGTGGSTGYSFGAGKVQGALFLVKNSQGYASIPAGLLDGATEMTIATWVYINSATDWQRVWDFGTDTSKYMFLSPRSGSTHHLRFGITVSGNVNEQGLNDSAELPVATWKHVAVVLGTGGGFLYVDGVLTASSTGLSLRPADLGATTNAYIGKSQFPDPSLDGNIDDFRVYNRALSADEVRALYNYAGP